VAQRGHVSGLTRMAVANTMLTGVALMAFALAPTFWLALVVLGIGSFAMTITGISSQSLVQNAVDGSLRGRVISIYGMIFRAGPATGALILGILSENFGWHWPMATSAALCLGIWVWGRRRLKTMAAALEI